MDSKKYLVNDQKTLFLEDTSYEFRTQKKSSIGAKKALLSICHLDKTSANQIRSELFFYQIVGNNMTFQMIYILYRYDEYLGKFYLSAPENCKNRFS